MSFALLTQSKKGLLLIQGLLIAQALTPTLSLNALVTVKADRIRPSISTPGTTTMTGNVTLQQNLHVTKSVVALHIKGVDATGCPAVLIKADGTLGIASTISTAASKENIMEMGSLSKKIMDLNPVTFTYKNDPKKEVQVGLLAEQVEQIFPKSGLVERSEDGKPAAIRYHMLTPLLINEYQQQQKQIQDLNAQMQELKAHVSKLQQKK